MDILKVLSRGTKKPSKTCIAKTGTVAALKLPSAGTEANPQLFHDDISQKRKRTVDMEDEKGMVKVRKVVVEGAEDLPEVDFFAQKMEGAEGGEEKVVVVAEEEEDDEESEDEEEERERLSEEECKEMLRSHRLKVTLLSKAPEPMVETKKKKKKKGKKEEVVEEEKSKKVKKQEKRVFPAPLECFDDLRRTYRVSRKLAENIAEQAYKIPTEVQMGALPLLINVAKALEEADARVVGGEERLERVDLLSVAPTGSGKTVGFLVPAINAIVGRREKVAENERREGFHELEAVVLAPTRELAYQIVNEARKLTKGMGLKVVLMKKGMRLAAEHNAEVSLEEEDDENDDDEESGSEKESQDENDDKDGPMTAVDILVTTPMPLLNYLTKSSTSKTPMVLPTVRSLILDEADVLLDQLFHDQTTCLWSLFTNPTLQHSLWSATMGSNIETLVASLLSSRATRLNTPPHPLLRLVVGLKDTAVPNIRHKLIFTGSELGKLYAIRQLLRPGPRTNDTISIRPPFIVFAQSIERAAALQDELRYDIPLAAGGSSRIAALHSGLTDSQRAAIMRQFRAGEIWILITTDVLARGVDFAGVNGVVNYDIPGSAAVYIHRAGRTGRAGREGGIAVTLWTKDDIPYVKIIANVITASDKQAGRTGEDLGVPESLLASLPTVSKAEKKKLKERGVEARRRGGQSAKITTKSGWERKKENTKEAAVEQSKRKKWLEKQQKKAARGAEKGKEEGKEEEWGGIDD